LRIEIDAGSPQPPGEQIQDQVRFAVAAGRLVPGDRLPSVRGLAAQALVNPNTVAKAYRELEREGTVETRPGDGVFVAGGATALCASLSSRVVGERVTRAVEEALAAGLSASAVRALVTRALASHPATHKSAAPSARQEVQS
jgi:GntR family transcriptional regulator